MSRILDFIPELVGAQYRTAPSSRFVFQGKDYGTIQRAMYKNELIELAKVNKLNLFIYDAYAVDFGANQFFVRYVIIEERKSKELSGSVIKLQVS